MWSSSGKIRYFNRFCHITVFYFYFYTFTDVLLIYTETKNGLERLVWQLACQLPSIIGNILSVVPYCYGCILTKTAVSNWSVCATVKHRCRSVVGIELRD